MLCMCVSLGQVILNYKKRNRLLCRQKTLNDRKCWKYGDGICLLENDYRERESMCVMLFTLFKWQEWIADTI